MPHNEKNTGVKETVLLLLVFLNVFLIKNAFLRNENGYLTLVLSLPVLFLVYWQERDRGNPA